MRHFVNKIRVSKDKIKKDIIERYYYYFFGKSPRMILIFWYFVIESSYVPTHYIKEGHVHTVKSSTRSSFHRNECLLTVALSSSFSDGSNYFVIHSTVRFNLWSVSIKFIVKISRIYTIHQKIREVSTPLSKLGMLLGYSPFESGEEIVLSFDFTLYYSIHLL